MNAILKKIESFESMIATASTDKEGTPFGLYVPSDDGPKLVKTIKKVKGEWVETTDKPKATLPLKMEPVLTRPKRFTIIIGGRGSGKSQSEGQIEVAEMHDYGVKIACFREFQNSIDDSVQSLLANQIRKIGLDGFSFTNTSVKSNNGAEAKFRGLARNPDSIKSMDGFKRFWIEEAQATSENSLKLLTPTMRESNGVMVFTANPASSEDPFSKRFIKPFKDHLDRHGIYEDELHLVVVANYLDNPWFPKELDQEREWDYANLPRALYDHIWMGAFNDSIDNALIMSEWFDACIDAHLKLNIEPTGARFAAHDPSDTGEDAKGYAARHGIVVYSIEEKTDGNINDGGDWACGLANSQNVDYYTYDCDGMGVGLARQTGTAFESKRTQITMFKGSESPDNPEALYNVSNGNPVFENKTNKQVFRNKRAQYYQMLRDRVYATYCAVIRGEYIDPDKMISFDSTMPLIGKLRSELCRMPIKPNSNGLIDLYTKQEMKSKFKFASPNLADSVMMLMRNSVRMNNNQVTMPPQIKSYRMR